MSKSDRALAPQVRISGSEPQALPTALVLMGVSGAGKTTIGQLLAADLGWTFLDADDFHPETNRQKMASGQALNDNDRRPWLERVGRTIRDHVRRGQSVTVACSALKQSYRETLTQSAGRARFVYLRGDKKLIAERLARRQGHFMPPALLASQFETLEEPAIDTWVLDIGPTPEQIVEEIRRRLANDSTTR